MGKEYRILLWVYLAVTLSIGIFFGYLAVFMFYGMFIERFDALLILIDIFLFWGAIVSGWGCILIKKKIEEDKNKDAPLCRPPPRT